MRLIYTLLFYLILPFILARLYWRGFKAPEYRKRWKERLAFYNTTYPKDVIWIHAVSVGEAEAVFSLVKQLQKQYPFANFLLTTTTPTGSARVQAVLANTVTHVYLPYDLPIVVKRFLATFSPKIAIFMEKEIWPNLYVQCAEKNIPTLIINARLSENSAKGYKWITALVKPVLSNVSWIAAQTEDDKRRFIEIGGCKKKMSVVGNLKFDLSIDETEKIIQQAQALKKELFAQRFVWVIASTHEGEEDIFLELYPRLKQHIPELLMVIVPRHPERFKPVQKLAERKQLKTVMRSSNKACTTETDIYIGDTMGELKLLYGASDICFVGGSMVPIGGHNILEPAAIGVPIMFGPEMINFKQIARNVLDLGAAIQCMDKESIEKEVVHLYKECDYRTELISKANQFIKSNQGATERTKTVITEIL
jgi:3-deoxy-D-manno-octulosonic-acid transferase